MTRDAEGGGALREGHAEEFTHRQTMTHTHTHTMTHTDTHTHHTHTEERETTAHPSRCHNGHKLIQFLSGGRCLLLPQFLEGVGREAAQSDRVMVDKRCFFIEQLCICEESVHVLQKGSNIGVLQRRKQRGGHRGLGENDRGPLAH